MNSYLFSMALASCSSFNCEWKLKNNEYTRYGKQLSLDIS